MINRNTPLTLAAILAALTLYALSSGADSVQRPIISVGQEFMQVSRALQKNFDRFTFCNETNECSVLEVLDEKERILRKEWPRVFDLLYVHDNWGVDWRSQEKSWDFLSEVMKYGVEEVRLQCRPIITYLAARWNDGKTEYYYAGLACPTTSNS